MTLNEHLTNQENLDINKLKELANYRFQVTDPSNGYFYLEKDNIMEALDNTEGATGRVSTFLIENRSYELMTFIKATSLKYWLAFVENKVLNG
jgi:hypothetical protein